MGSKYEKTIYELLGNDPVTASEIARRVGVSYKTAQQVLLYLAASRKDVAYRNSGRIYLFWKK